MKKRVISLVLAMALSMSMFMLVGCNDFDLSKYKEDKKAELETYANEYNEEIHWSIIDSYLSDGKSQIEKLKTKKEIDDLIVNYKNMIDNIVGIEEKVKDAYLQLPIMADHPDATTKDVVITEFFGIYNGSYVAVLNDNYHTIFSEYIVDLEIDGIDFSYSNGYAIRVWNNGVLYMLKDAYDQGILSRDNLERLEYLRFAQGEFPESYIKREAKETFYNLFIKDEFLQSTIADVEIMIDLGIYQNSFVAVYASEYLQIEDAEEKRFHIDDVEISYSQDREIYVWCNWKIYGLYEAYCKGFLTKEDVLTVWQLYQQNH